MLKKWIIKKARKYIKNNTIEVSGGHNLFTDKKGNLCIVYYFYVAGILAFEKKGVLFQAGADKLGRYKEKKQFKKPKK